MLPWREVWFACLVFTILKSTWIQINWDDLLLSFFACHFFLFFFFIFGSLLRQAHALKNRSFGDGWSDGGAWAMRIKPQSLIRLYYYVNLKNNVCITLITALLLQHRHLNGWVCKCPFYIGRKSHLNTGDSCFIYGETKWVFRPFLSASCIYVI